MKTVENSDSNINLQKRGKNEEKSFFPSSINYFLQNFIPLHVVQQIFIALEEFIARIAFRFKKKVTYRLPVFVLTSKTRSVSNIKINDFVYIFYSWYK